MKSARKDEGCVMSTSSDPANHRRWTAVESIELSAHAQRGDRIVCPACASSIGARVDRRSEIIYVDYTCPTCANTTLFGFPALEGAGDCRRPMATGRLAVPSLRPQGTSMRAVSAAH